MGPFRSQRWHSARDQARRRLARAGKGILKATRRYRILRDVVGALVLVAIVLGATTIATGGKWPPVVVVESGSMMHAVQETPYGRFGTIDVGDIVFLRDVDARDEIRLWIEGGEKRYGRPGDVIAFAANGDRANASTPIVLHRAITWVDVWLDPGTNAPRYRVHWIDGQSFEFGSEGIYFPPLGFDEPNGFTRANGYRPPHSGFLTKGDNAYTNPAVDQALGLSQAVDPSWVEGTIHGEIPWMGLGKLALQTSRTNPTFPGWERIGNAFAPIELWSMFFLVVALVILVPFTLDTYRAWRQHRARIAFERATRTEAAALRREARARDAAAKPAAPPQAAPRPRATPVAKPTRREPVAFTTVPAPGTRPPP